MNVKLIKTIRSVILCIVASSSATAAPPESVASKAQNVRTFFGDVVHPSYWVHLMVLPTTVHVDPSPQAKNFESAAKVMLAIEADAAYDLIHRVLKEIDSSSWREMARPGYAGAYWQVRGPSGESLIDFLIDETGSLVCHEGTWYGVDTKLVAALTTDTIRVGTDLLGKRRTPDWKP